MPARLQPNDCRPALRPVPRSRVRTAHTALFDQFAEHCDRAFLSAFRSLAGYTTVAVVVILAGFLLLFYLVLRDPPTIGTPAYIAPNLNHAMADVLLCAQLDSDGPASH